jgi:O-antigen/teichoic acid export membrane protein
MVLRLGSNLLMTRLLVPEMFGVMSVASTVMIGLAMFSDFGLRQSVVQNVRGGDPTYLNTAWRIQILRGVLLWLVALCISILLGLAQNGVLSKDSVYAAPSLPPIIAALSFSAVIGGLTSTKILEANRGLTLGLITRIEISTQVVGLACMVSWVVFDRSVWALVAGSLGATLARTMLSHAWLPGSNNSWEFDKVAALEIFHMGKWIFLASILGFLVNSGDQLLLAGLVNPTIFGLYVIASLYIGAIDGVLARLMGDISFPALSEIVRERPRELKEKYYEFHRVIAAVAYSVSGFLIAFGQSLIGILYDARYQYSGRILQIIAVILLTVPFRLATQSFLALGLPKLQSHVTLVRLISLVLLTPVGFHFFGLIGALCAIVFSHFAYIPLIISYNVKHKLFDMKREIILFALVPAGYGIGIVCSTMVEKLRSLLVVIQ